MKTKTSRAALKPFELAARLGLQEWQVIRAANEGMIPARNRTVGWSADLAEEIALGKRRIKAKVGKVPDWSGWDTADWLARRFGLTVYVETVRELHRLGHLTLSKWAPSEYCGRSLEAFANLDTAGDIIVAAAETGRTLMASQAAERLQIRRTDFDHLIRAGLVVPITSKLTGYTSKRHDPGMDLYRQGDIDALAAVATVGGIPWATVRSVKPAPRLAAGETAEGALTDADR